MPISKNEAEISLLVHPGATKNEVLASPDGILRMKVAAPPARGKANRELLALLSRLLDISKSCISIKKGHTSRRKLIAIDGLSREEVMRRLSSSSDDATSRINHRGLSRPG